MGALLPPSAVPRKSGPKRFGREKSGAFALLSFGIKNGRSFEVVAGGVVVGGVVTGGVMTASAASEFVLRFLCLHIVSTCC